MQPVFAEYEVHLFCINRSGNLTWHGLNYDNSPMMS